MTLLRKDAEICIEGFPRSGNSFFTVYFWWFNSIHPIGHHLHVIAQIKRAVKYKIPCIILYRHPLDAVASLLVMDRRLSLTVAIHSYIQFNKYVVKEKKNVVTAEFRKTISAPDSVLKEVNEKFGSTFDCGYFSPELSEQIQERIRNSTAVLYTPQTLTVPNKYKTEEKKKLYASIENHSSYKKAVAVYETLLSLDRAD